MGSSRRQRMRKKFSFDTNRKRQWKKKTKKNNIGCKIMKEAWDGRKSLLNNLNEMGLAYDPNKAVSKGMNDNEDQSKKSRIVKPHVLEAMEIDASKPETSTLWTSPEEANFVMSMMDKHGEDYAAMARDSLNIFQHTPKQIRRKIVNFKKIPGLYEDYLATRTVGILKTYSLLPDMVSRKKTRRYEAARRNGHFTPTHNQDDCVVVQPASISKVKRRLHFGRKPPKIREFTTEFPDVDKQHPIDPSVGKDQNDGEREKYTAIRDTKREQVDEVSGLSPAMLSPKKEKGKRLKRELRYLLQDADNVVYPVRLRSTLHSLVTCYNKEPVHCHGIPKIEEQSSPSCKASTSRQS